MEIGDKPFEIEVTSSSTVCAGMVAAYLCRAIALRAGRYAPGIHEHVFSSLRDRYSGGDLDGVSRWFRESAGPLFSLGYLLTARRVAFRTPMIEKWVAAGDGLRAALLGTDGQRFHSTSIRSNDNGHAIGLVAEVRDRAAQVPLTVIDPWPGVPHKRLANGDVEPAHRSRNYSTLLVFWTGHS